MIQRVSQKYSGHLVFVEDKSVDPNIVYTSDAVVITRQIYCDIIKDKELFIFVKFDSDFFENNPATQPKDFAHFVFDEAINSFMYESEGLNCYLDLFRSKGVCYLFGHVYPPNVITDLKAKEFRVYGEIKLE